jgi:hypothetical protein
MPKHAAHPFTINIRTRRWMHGRFCWSIRQAGQVVREGSATYPRFEDARVAGKEVLDQMVTAWSYDAGLMRTGS